MAPTICPCLPFAMKGIQHKAEVWLSRESKQARTPFRSASFLMSRREANKRPKKRERRERERGKKKEREREHFARVILKRKERGSQAKCGTGLPRWRRLVRSRCESLRCASIRFPLESDDDVYLAPGRCHAVERGETEKRRHRRSRGTGTRVHKRERGREDEESGKREREEGMEKRNQVSTFIGLRRSPAVHLPCVCCARLFSFLSSCTDAEKEQATENHNH